MPPVKISLDGLTDGVSTRPMPERSRGSVKQALNTMMRRHRGLEKRPGTALIKAPTTNFNLDITNPQQSKFYHWIDRSEFEKFLIVVDPLNTGVARVECFTLVTRGNGNGTAGNEAMGQKMTLSSTLSGSDDPLDYVASAGTTVARHRFRALTVTDTTLLANRDVTTGVTGSSINYRKADTSLIRKVGTSNNKASWNDFPQPALGVAPAGLTTSDYIFYARDNDLGWPAGWYRASSTTTPPWYERIRTEPAGSEIDHTKFPVQIKFNGSAFVLSFPNWAPRCSGDSLTNPGPQMVTGPSGPHKIRDMCFFQSRLWFGTYEFIDSSQSGDVFNLWNNSYVALTDADAINISLQSDAVTTVDWIVPFDGGIVALTRGARQFEIRSQGAMTPSTVSILPTTAYYTVDYCAPVKLGNQLYFMGERNGSVIIYEYLFQADRSSNVATDITSNVEGYIPTRVWTMQESSLNDMLFLLTTSEVQNLYVNQMKWENGQNSQRAWMVWDRDQTVHACRVMGQKLFLLVQRSGGRLYLETMNIDLPTDDDSGEVPTTVNGYTGSGSMGFDLCLDAKSTYQGTYDAGTDTTTWTIPFEDNTIDRVVLGQRWDCNYEFPSGTFNEQRWKGRVLKPVSEGGILTVTASGGSTTITAPGNWAQNGNGDNARVWIGCNYEMRVTLNEQFVRDDTGVVSGLVQLRHLMLRVVDTADLKVEITPQGRDTLTFQYTNGQVGLTPPGSGLDFPEYEEFNLPCLGRAYDTEIEIVNDSVFPSRVVGGEFRATFVPARKDPTRK